MAVNEHCCHLIVRRSLFVSSLHFSMAMRPAQESHAVVKSCLEGAFFSFWLPKTSSPVTNLLPAWPVMSETLVSHETKYETTVPSCLARVLFLQEPDRVNSGRLLKEYFIATSNRLSNKACDLSGTSQKCNGRASACETYPLRDRCCRDFMSRVDG